jgi:hypothetical protein
MQRWVPSEMLKLGQQMFQKIQKRKREAHHSNNRCQDKDKGVKDKGVRSPFPSLTPFKVKFTYV